MAKKKKKIKCFPEHYRWSPDVSWAQRPYAEVNLGRTPTGLSLKGCAGELCCEFQLQLVVQGKCISDALKQLAFPKYLVEKKKKRSKSTLSWDCAEHTWSDTLFVEGFPYVFWAFSGVYPFLGLPLPL